MLCVNSGRRDLQARFRVRRRRGQVSISVRPYVKSNNNDVADAEAICEAFARHNMRFVPVKSVEQQAVLSLHRPPGICQGAHGASQQIRGLLSEVGLFIPVGISHPLAISRPQKPKQTTTANSPVNPQRWQPALNQTASMKPGAVHLRTHHELKAWQTGASMYKLLSRRRGRAKR
jgi:hypothetical protein